MRASAHERTVKPIYRNSVHLSLSYPCPMVPSGLIYMPCDFRFPSSVLVPIIFRNMEIEFDLRPWRRKSCQGEH